MQISFVSDCSDLFLPVPKKFTDWFLNRPKRTAYICSLHGGEFYLANGYQYFLITRDYILPIEIESGHKTKLSSILSESPLEETATIYVAVSPFSKVVVGFLSKIKR